MQYKVLKKFSTDRPLEIGEIVELEGRNVDKLVELRYLAPLGVVVPKLAHEVVPAASAKPEPTPVKASEPKRKRGRPKKTDAGRVRVVTLPPTTSD